MTIFGNDDRCSEYYSCTCCNAANPKTKIKKQIEGNILVLRTDRIINCIVRKRICNFPEIKCFAFNYCNPNYWQFARRGRFMRSEIWWAMLFVPKNTEL